MLLIYYCNHLKGMLMTPPASPPLSSNPTSQSRNSSHSTTSSSTTVATTAHHQHSLSSQQLIPTVPSATAAALSKMVQAAHSWRPEEPGRLAEQAWQDSLLSPTGICRPSEPASSWSTTQTAEKDSTTNLWDFIDPTIKSSCSCVK